MEDSSYMQWQHDNRQAQIIMMSLVAIVLVFILVIFGG